MDCLPCVNNAARAMKVCAHSSQKSLRENMERRRTSYHSHPHNLF